MTKAGLLLCLLLAACEKPSTEYVNHDTCLARELFAQCLEKVPAGPQRVTSSNDWAEVVEECRRSAYYLSERPKEHTPAGCVEFGR